MHLFKVRRGQSQNERHHLDHLRDWEIAVYGNRPRRTESKPNCTEVGQNVLKAKLGIPVTPHFFSIKETLSYQRTFLEIQLSY